MFCDLGGYTRWNEEEDPEDVALVMDAIRSAATRIFEAHGGIVNQFVGDEVMGIFGIVSSHEDDPSRALAAALAFHAFLRSGESFEAPRPWPLRLHSGAESGLIYARMHDPRGGLFEVTGEAVNTAARLRALAKQDELLCGPALQRQVEHFYKLEPLAPTRVHLTAQPITPMRVIEATTSISRFEAAARRGLTRYVDREVELQTLLNAWERSERGRGEVVAIVGPPGIGKTRFVHEFRQRIRSGMAVLHGHCSAYRNVAPYQPFIDALNGLLEGAAFDVRDVPARLALLAERYALSPAARRALAYLLTPGSESASAPESPHAAELRAAIVAALSELYAAMSSERPVLIILEDWHWADEASRSALRQISQELEARPVMIAVTYRSTELTEAARPRSTVTIELAPLDSDHTESMARHVLGGGVLPLGLSTFVHSRTLGNPLFVEEICRALVESGACRVHLDSIVLLEPLFQVRAPSTVQAIVRARVDRLPAEQRELLRLAAVIGPEFDLSLLDVLAKAAADAPGPLHLLGLLRELERQDLVHRSGTQPSAYRFKHAITREVVYESLPVRARRLHHARLAQALELRTPAEELEPHYESLALHYRLGHVRDKAIAFAVLAGDKAWRSFALEQAGLQYRHALEELAANAASSDAIKSRHIDVSLSWARVGIYNPHADQVAALGGAYRFALDLGDRFRAALCLNWSCWIAYGRGDHPPSLQFAERFLEESERLGETRLIAQAHINLGRCAMIACEYERAEAAIERGLSMRVRREGAAHSFALSNLAMVFGDRGDFPRAYARIAESERVALNQLSLLGPLLVLRAIVEVWQGEWQAALATCARADDVAQRIEGKYIAAMSRLVGGYARFMSSFEVAALARTREGIEELEKLGIRLHMSCNWGMLAAGLATAGQYDQAEAAAQRALLRADELDRQGESEALRVLALVAALRDRQLARAEAWLARALAAARAKPSERDLALCDLASARVFRAHHEPARADAAEERARARAAQIGMVLPRELKLRGDQLELDKV